MIECGKISVVIPVYNGELYIVKCLQSIADQTFQNLEVILVNDGSTDRTLVLAEEFAREHEIDIRIFNRENGGQAAGRNYGLEQVTGEYVAFLDSDDYIDPDYLQKLFETAEAYHSDVVTCGCRHVKTDGTLIREASVSPFAEVCEYGKAGVFVVWSKLFRTEFLKAGGYSFQEGGKIYEDVPFSLLTKFMGQNVKAISYIGYNYVYHEGSTMSSGRVKSDRFPYEKMTEAVTELAKSGDVDSKRAAFEVLHFFAGFLFFFCRKAQKEDLKKLCTYASRLIGDNFPEYWKNPYVGLGRSRELPLMHRMAIRIFVLVNRMGILYPFSYIITR